MGDDKQNMNDTKELLRRGGCSLSLAALGRYHHPGQGRPRWNVLDPTLSAPADEIFRTLQTQKNLTSLDNALKHAMSHESTTSPPPWAIKLIDHSPLTEPFCSAVMKHELSGSMVELFPDIQIAPPRRQLSLVLAAALCRNLDTVRSLTQRLETDEAIYLWRGACLAAVTVPSGFPSSLRTLCRQLVLGDLA